MTEIGGSESSQLLSSITETEDKAEGDEDPEHTGDMGQEVSGRDSDGGDEMMETYSESNSTAISHNINHRQLEGGGAAGGARAGGSQFVRAEPLSAKQQVALWLTRTSTQELYHELRMSNLRTWVTGDAAAAGAGRPRAKQPLCGPSSSSQIHRNFSTKSLLESGSYGCHFHEPGHGDNNPMRKCETVIALSEEPRRKKNSHFPKSKSKVSLYASRMSFFKRSGSKCHSEIMQPSHLQPPAFPGIRPTNRLR